MENAIQPPRLPDDTHIGRARLRVADLGRSLAFYQDVLGLRVASTEGRAVTLAAGDQPDLADPVEPRELIILEETPGISRRPARPVTTGLYHVALLVPSRRALGRALLGLHGAGYPLRGTADHAVSESIYLDDPDGNGLEIYADRPRALWPVEDGVIQMTVDPMDVAGVLDAAGERGEPWQGLPRETVVGHVHFTVSQLDPAVAFYRDMVGFEAGMRWPSLAAVAAGGYHHHLNLNTWAGEGAPRDKTDVAGLESWELRVPQERDRNALLQRLGAAGALTDSSTSAIARDPDGNRMEVSEG
jgi:catechol 2,3-dioxygenase